MKKNFVHYLYRIFFDNTRLSNWSSTVIRYINSDDDMSSLDIDIPEEVLDAASFIRKYEYKN